VPEPESVRAAFEKAAAPLADVERYVKSTLESYCNDRNYIFKGRSKTATSLAEKLEGGRYSKWSRLDDLYACTIVIPVAAHQPGVLRDLDRLFTKKRVRGRTDTNKAPDVFRFDGTRWYGTIKPEAAAERQVGAGEIIFEVQIATAFENAWSTVTHDIVYKADVVDWRQLRLAAQLKAAVEQVEVLISAFETAAGAIESSPWSETSTKAEIVATFQTLHSDGHIPELLVPASWRRFADNVYGLVVSYTPEQRKVPQAVKALLSAIEDKIRGSGDFKLPTSGSLFQLVTTIVASEDGPGSLDEFVVIDSAELHDFYGMQDAPKVFEFDGTSADLTEP